MILQAALGSLDTQKDIFLESAGFWDASKEFKILCQPRLRSSSVLVRVLY